MRYFDEHGKPINGAEAFFHDPSGSGFYEPTEQWETRYTAVAEHVRNFDGSLITESLVNNWSVAETIAQGLEDDAEASSYPVDWETVMDRDMSMNH